MFFIIWDYGREYFNIPELSDTILHSLFIGVFVGLFFYYWNIKPALKH
jgi:hypothetical protein